jgi:triosephosphate isomerase
LNKKYRKAIIVGNWKMNMVASEVKPFVDELRRKMPKTKTCEIVLCAPFPLIPALWRSIKDSRISIGAQNVSEYERGAYTGEASVSMLYDLGVKYVIIGHSERREYFKETDFQVNAKVRATVDGGMTPIICVGESHEQRIRDLTMECIAYQVKAALSGIPPEKVRKCVIAYEPVWAIGTGNTATPEQTQEVCEHIRKVIRACHGAYVARAVSILYGGSMNAKNACELLAMPDIDGGLIGGASLNPEDFATIVTATDQETD